MKNIRPVFLTLAFVAGITSTVMYISCNKNKCGSVTCQNGSTCSGSKCVCPKGYSGPSCGLGWTDPLVGTYTCHRSNCSPAIADTNAWQSVVTKASTDGGFNVNISNFDHGNITVEAVIDTYTNISISPPVGSPGVHATGKYANGTITLAFTVSSTAGITYACDMKMIKQ